MLNTIKSLIKENMIYKNYIKPLRIKYQSYKDSKLSDEEYFIKRHKRIFKYTPNFKNPKTFNEKIINRILYDRNIIYSYLADKLKARIYIAYKLKQIDSIDSTNRGGGRRKILILA